MPLIKAGKTEKTSAAYICISVMYFYSCALTSDLCLIQPAVLVQGQEPLTASMLASAPPQEQKQMLGQ